MISKAEQQKAFEEVYGALNAEQKLAVDTIDGPVMVIAGPGTGKTQILGARIGKILIETNELFDTDGVTIIGYTHNITFENVSFSNPDNTFSFTTYIFGDYETDL